MRTVYFILLSAILGGCTRPVFKSKWTNEIAPGNFTAVFETSKGNIEIDIKREWSPKAVDRFYQLLKHHFYNNAIFYRGVPNFVVQFGISDTAKSEKWQKFKVPDEKVVQSNERGALSFARAGKETRGTELFINLKNNPRLDTLTYESVTGFPVFGKVTKGMETVDSIYTGYGEKTMDKLDSFYLNRTQFLNTFPKLDAVIKAYVKK